MGKKSRLKKERRRIKNLDGISSSGLSVNRMVEAIAMEYASIEHIRMYLSSGADIDALADAGFSMLHVASGKGNMKLVRYLLEQGADPNRRGKFGNRVLHIAVESDNPHVVQALLKAGALPDGENEDRLTALHRAVKVGNAKAVAALGEAGANYSTWPTDEYETYSVLQAAVANNYPEVINALVKLGANPEIGSDGISPLMLSVNCCKTETVQALLGSGANFKVINRNGLTALTDAVGNLHLGAVQALLEAGADPDQVDGKGNKPLRSAVGTGHLEMIRVLLDSGAKVDAVGGLAITALKWAGWLAAPEIAQLLLERGADADYDGGDELTPMHMVALSSSSVGFIFPEIIQEQANYSEVNEAIRMARHTAHSKPKETVRTLVKAGAAVDAVNRREETPLFMAAGVGEGTLNKMSIVEGLMGMGDFSEATDQSIDMVRRKVRMVLEAFLESGADIEFRGGGQNQTPLNRAAQSGVAEAVKALVEAGADMEAKNDSGRTPLHEAVIEGEPESIRILMAAGADTEARTPDGATPAELAVKSDRRVAETILREFESSGG